MSIDPLVQQLLDEVLDSERTPEEVCSAFPDLLPEVKERWQRIRHLQDEIDDFFPPPSEAGGVTSPYSPANLNLPRIEGYEVESVLGRGGMGIVFRARHLRLNRIVALKMALAGEYAGQQERERFQREAEAEAELRHPNIVQIYDVGDSEGRPYFSMEYMEGGTLTQKLAGAPLPIRQAATLLVTLAEAVNAAHQCGIIHRDLKPANVLLAADGTTKISDFGLARRLDGQASLTRTGTPMGTPSYMAPEQASGQSFVSSPAVDIYALGAILYELLTGRPPFVAESSSDTIQQVITQDPVPPSRLNGKVPRDLETICLKCLEKAPDRRYRSAVALAEDLKRFLRNEPIVARPVGLLERGLRWCSRNPTMAGLVATLTALFLLTVFGGLWWEHQKAEQQGRAQEAIEGVLAQIPGLRQQGRWSEAQALLTQGKSRLDEAGSDDLRREIAKAEADLQVAVALEQIRLTPALENNRFDYRGMADAYARAFEQAALDIRGDEKIVAARIRGSSLGPQFVIALDHWAYVADELGDRRLMARLLLLARHADPDSDWGDRFRDSSLWGDSVALQRLAAEAEQRLTKLATDKGPPIPLITLLAKKLGQKDGQAEPLLRAAQTRHPGDFWLNFALGEALRERKPAEAVGFYRAALVTRPTVAAVHLEVSAALLRLGHVDEAIFSARKVIELIPTFSRAHHQLGVCLQAKGQFDEAMAEYRRAIELDPNGAAAHHQLGVCLHRRGKLDEAITEYRRAIELDPTGGPAHHSLGLGLQDKRLFDEAIAEYRRAIQFDPNGAAAHVHLGLCLKEKGQLDEAMAEYRRVIELDPKCAPAHHELGICFQAKGQIDEAITEYRRAIELEPTGAPAHHQLGVCLQGRRQFDEAMNAFRHAIKLDPKEFGPRYHLGLCWQAKDRLPEAVAEYRRVVELNPDWGHGHLWLATTLLRCGRFADARTVVLHGLEVLPANGPDRPAMREKLLQCERMLALDIRLPALLDGKEHLAATELIELASLCQNYGRSQAAVRLYSAAFAAQPSLANDPRSGNRYTAACAAAQAASDQDFAKQPLGEPVRAEMRQQAITWLRAELALRTRLQNEEKQLGWSVTSWQSDPKLTSIRDRRELTKLTEVERESWQRFWGEVAALRASDSLERGREYALRQEWAQAADSYERATKSDPIADGNISFEYAALMLLSGDRQGYDKACARMLERCGKVSNLRAYHVARACTLAPNTLPDASLPGRLAEKELQASAKAFWSLTEQGALQYRAGRFQQAVSLFEESVRADPKVGRAILNWLWLALTKQRLGSSEEARQYLVKAQTLLDKYRDGMPARVADEMGFHLHNWLEAHILLREAEALIFPSTLPK